MLPVATYFLARLVLFAGCAVVLRLLGAGPFLALVGGLLTSLLLSYVLLRRLREPATAAVAERMQARTARRATQVDEDALIEDAQVDEVLRERDRG
ncbi:MAG TPA: DUF4229 domain-containing protein [Kineosporiaceae bacterium]|nr:DUF4229 domain-containing protein [Kineosporiaceae bacterium]